MEFSDMRKFEYLLEICFTGTLPGIQSHLMLASTDRIPDLLNKKLHSSAKKSSVLILFYEKAEGVFLVFIKRPVYGGVHSGQVSFPGGKWEKKDRTLYDTALRETAEEIGIEPSRVKLIGNLSQLYIPPSNYIVNPYVGIYEGKLNFKPDPKEVASIIEVPVEFLLEHIHGFSHTDIQLMDGSIIRSPALIFQGNIIWGATAMILNEFLILWKTTVNN